MQHVVHEDYLNDDLKLEIERFDRSVEDQLSDQNFTFRDQNGFYIQDKSNDAPTRICEEDYGNMDLPETPDVDAVEDGLVDKYVNVKLIFEVVTGTERKGRVVKPAQGGPLVSPLGARTPTCCSTPVSMWSTSQMDHPKTTLQMSAPSACMHKLTLKRFNINSSTKSRITVQFYYPDC